MREINKKIEFFVNLESFKEIFFYPLINKLLKINKRELKYGIFDELKHNCYIQFRVLNEKELIYQMRNLFLDVHLKFLLEMVIHLIKILFNLDRILENLKKMKKCMNDILK